MAARLSEDPARSVCLLEAGPDYGPLDGGRWPEELLDPRALVFTHDWGTGGEDDRSLGARVIGGCSTHNACLVLAGTPADYDEWGPGLGSCAPGALPRAGPGDVAHRGGQHRLPAPFHSAFLAAAAGARFPPAR